MFNRFQASKQTKQTDTGNETKQLVSICSNQKCSILLPINEVCLRYKTVYIYWKVKKHRIDKEKSISTQCVQT